MPLFKAVPRGFYLIQHTLNTLSPSLLRIILHDICALHHGRIYSLPIQYYLQISKLSETTVNAITNTLLFIIRTIHEHQTQENGNNNNNNNTNNIVEILTKETDLNSEVCNLIATQWTSSIVNDQQIKSTNTNSDLKSFLQLPFVNDFRWKIGVTLSSSQKELNHIPFVTLQFSTIDTTKENHPIHEYTFRMKREEYNEFAQTFYEIENQMESL